MCGRIVFCPIVHVVGFFWAPIKTKVWLLFLVLDPVEPNVHGFCCLWYDFVGDYPVCYQIVSLDQCWWLGCPISASICHSCITSLLLTKRAPSSASMVKDITCLSIFAFLWMAPLFGRKAILVDMKTCPPPQLHALGSLRYEALLWVVSIMSLALYMIIALGLVAA